MSDTPQVDIAALLADPAAAQEILKSLAGNPDALRKVIEDGRKILRESKKSETSEEDEQKRETLKPFAEAVEAAEKEFAEFKKQWDDRLEEVKTERKNALDEAQKEVDKVKSAYNDERENLGLKTNRAASVGPTINWHVRILDVDAKTAEIGVKEQENTYVTTTLNDKGSVPSKWVRENIIDKNQIVDPNGGRLRGLLTKIKGAYADAVAEKNGGAGGETPKAEGATPDAEGAAAPSAEGAAPEAVEAAVGADATSEQQPTA
jgi:hypothetical protein